MDRRGDETRERILEAAIAVFSERGYHGSTIQMIVHGAQANQAAVNYHFGGKAKLYSAVMEATMARLIRMRADQLDHWLTAEDPLEALVRDLLSENAMGMEERERLHRLMAWERLNPSGVDGGRPMEFMRDHFEAIMGVVSRETGRDPACEETKRMAVWVLGQCAIFGMPGPSQEMLEKARGDVDERRTFIEETTAWLVPRIRAGLALSA